jgi:cytochrome c553
MGVGRCAARLCAGVTAAALLNQGAALSAPSEPFPAWAFPPLGRDSAAGPPDAKAPLHVPGSTRAFTEAQTQDLYVAPDWFPGRHPAAPAIVLVGRRGSMRPCGYCHLPDGSGRPENATLAGLPAAYIRDQVAAFRSGSRKGADPNWSPMRQMADTAAQATEAEVAATADYFASISYRGHVRVAESARIPGALGRAFLLRAVPGPGEPLGQRIVEGPSSFERFELRDPTLVYTAYVPPGSLARGAVLARTGRDGFTTPCLTCHGAGLRGGAAAVGPPLAGRSPSYLFRQLYAFQAGGRADAQAAAMQQVTAKLSQADMIALAAYAASLRP